MNFIKSLYYGGKCNAKAHSNALALKITDLSFRYSNTLVLKDINLSITPGERIALVGPNGAGKSTLLKVILGTLIQQEGSVEIYGNLNYNCHHRAAIVSQRTSIDWSFPLTVKQVVTMGCYSYLGWLKKPKSEDHQKVHDAMETMNILDIANCQISEISGGQQQRVMLARVLVQDADLLLLDEPLNHLDIATQEIIFHTLEQLSLKGKTVIVSTHDLGVLTVHFNRALFLDKYIIADGPVSKVITPETLARAYGFEFHQDYTNA